MNAKPCPSTCEYFDPMHENSANVEKYFLGHHVHYEYTERSELDIDWMYSAQHPKVGFWHFLCPAEKRCTFLTHFLKVGGPSPPPAATATIRFVHIMSVVIIPALCKQKFDALCKECLTNQYNECLKFAFFNYIFISPMN